MNARVFSTAREGFPAFGPEKGQPGPRLRMSHLGCDISWPDGQNWAGRSQQLAGHWWLSRAALTSPVPALSLLLALSDPIWKWDHLWGGASWSLTLGLSWEGDAGHDRNWNGMRMQSSELQLRGFGTPGTTGTGYGHPGQHCSKRGKERATLELPPCQSHWCTQ